MEERREKDYRLINMDDVEARKVDWLWYPYIPYGKVSIVQGDPGEGKTTFILRLAALLTKGEPLPGGGGTESQGTYQRDISERRGRPGRHHKAPPAGGRS